MRQKFISKLDYLRKQVEENPAAFSAIWVIDHIRDYVGSISDDDYMDAVVDEHNDAAIAVLEKRSEVCRKVIKDRIRTGRHYDVSFFAGKREGYEQAVDLLKESTESIRIEL